MERYKNAIFNFYQYQRAAHIWDRLNNINYAVVKGEPLSLLAYGNVGMRKTNDIDVLVSRKDIDYVVEALNSAGFFQQHADRYSHVVSLAHSHQLLPFVSFCSDPQTVIDVNFDIVWGTYEGQRIDIDEFLADVSIQNIYGFQIKSLSPIKTLIQLALHGYKDANSLYLLATRKHLNPRSFKDIYNLLKMNGEFIDPLALEKMCEVYEVSKYVYYMLYYTYLWLGGEFIVPYVNALHEHADMSIMNAYGLRFSERQIWNIPFHERIGRNDLDKIVTPHLTTKQRRMIEYNKIYLE